MVLAPAISAWMSPIALSGVRLLPGDDAQHVARGLAAARQVHRRQHQALRERVGRERGQPARRHAADVGDVDQRAAEVRDAPVGEHGPEHEDVVGVDAAAVRVVQRVDVAGAHGLERELLDERGERAAQARRVHEAGGRRQRDELALGVEDRRAGVGAFLDEGAVRGPHHHDARLFGRDEQGAADDLGGDLVVNRRCHGIRVLASSMGWVDRARSGVERVTGIEPAWPDWKSGTLPLSYTRVPDRPASGRGESNPRPPAPKAGALAAALLPVTAQRMGTEARAEADARSGPRATGACPRVLTGAPGARPGSDMPGALR